MKNAASIRKLAYIFIIICLLPLTACMSKEEKAKARNNEALARPIVQEYLEANYGSGKIKSLDCLNGPSQAKVIPIYNDYASSYVKSSVIVDKKEFSVIANVETGQCYDNYNEGLIVDDFKNYAVSSLSIPVPYDIEVHYYLKDLDCEIGDSSDYADFTEHGMSSVDGLFKKDQYQIYLVCKYIASDMDFGSVDTKRFFPASKVSDVYLALINFRSNDRYIDGDMVSLGHFDFDRSQHYYSLSDVVTAYKEKELDTESEKFIYSDSVNYSYARYLSENIDGIEFVWNDFDYALDFKMVPAEKEVQPQYSNEKTFYSTDEKAVSVESTRLLDNLYDSDPPIYCYFDKALYKKQMIITRSSDSDKSCDIWPIKVKTDSYICRSMDNYGKKTTFTLGFYKSK